MSADSDDFMFQLNKAEFDNLKSQIVRSSWGGILDILPANKKIEFLGRISALISGDIYSRLMAEKNKTGSLYHVGVMPNVGYRVGY